MVYSPVEEFHEMPLLIACHCAFVPLKVIFVSLLQFSNAEEKMFLTLLGIVMLVKLVQPANVEESMFFTLFGIVMLFRLLQP